MDPCWGNIEITHGNNVGCMTFDKFQEFIDEQDVPLRYLEMRDESERETILARTIKMSEEFGEFCDEILASMGCQRKGKMKGHNKEGLTDEFADVVNTTFLLAKAMNVDIPTSLDRKVKKVREKHNREPLS